MAGNKLAIFMLVIFRRFKPMAIINRPPEAVISAITSSDKNPDMLSASKAMKPWYKKTGIAENATPAPKLDVKAIDEVPSSNDLAYKIS